MSLLGEPVLSSVKENAASSKMDRRANPPFALQLFYRTGAFHRPDEFSHFELPPHLTIHTWPSCTMNELSHHLAFTTPSILPDPAIGTRLSFRLLFPDTRASANSSAVQAPKYMVKDLGSIVIGDGGPGLDLDDPTNPRNINQAGADSDDANKTLADARFVTGDYISVAILPPLGDGSVAPASAARMGRGAGAGEAGTVVGRAPGALAGERENGFGGRRGGRARRPESSSRGGGFGVPFGEWRRGERLPEVSRGGRAPPAERRRGDGPSEPSYSRSRGRGRY